MGYIGVVAKQRFFVGYISASPNPPPWLQYLSVELRGGCVCGTASWEEVAQELLGDTLGLTPAGKVPRTLRGSLKLGKREEG